MIARRHFVLASFLLSATSALSQQSFPLSISVRDAHALSVRGDILLVDIRTPDEWRETGVAVGAYKIDMLDPQFVEKLRALREAHGGKPVALICHSAGRTSDVQRDLVAKGWSGLINVRGGMAGNWRHGGWISERLPVTR